jgi:hypothetical protein
MPLPQFIPAKFELGVSYQPCKILKEMVEELLRVFEEVRVKRQSVVRVATSISLVVNGKMSCSVRLIRYFSVAMLLEKASYTWRYRFFSILSIGKITT